MEFIKREKEFIHKLDSWAEFHRKSSAFAVLRILLGVLLIATAIAFVRTDKLPTLLLNSIGFGSWAFSSFIIMMQFTAGFMIGVGLQARYFSLAMIPVLLGAVVMEYMTHGHTGLVLSVIALLGVFFFSIFDSGYYSADTALNKESEEEDKFFNR
jgi:putative oxidoreductase